MYCQFNDFVNEKLGIRDDVLILSDFLYNILKDSKKKSDQYIYEITKQTIRHNEESINLMLSIINDHEKDTGAYKN